MKQVLISIIAFLLACTGAMAQVGDAYTHTFQDSVRLSLENTRATDAMAVAAAFQTAWSSLGPDQQFKVRSQAKQMKKKRYKLIPHLVNYYGAIASAISIENTDGDRLNNYLAVAGKVIEKDNITQANIFFQQSRNFFEHHSLNVEKFFQLNVKDDDYQFDYLEPVSVSDTVQTFEEQPTDTSWYNAPQWQQPIVQPELFGPVISFTKLSLDFITPYDTVALTNTKGVFSLRDKFFEGDGGRFDWTAAGLSSDSVYYDLNKYNFKTTQPVLKAEQGRLTYVGKLATNVAGVFESNT